MSLYSNSEIVKAIYQARQLFTIGRSAIPAIGRQFLVERQIPSNFAAYLPSGFDITPYSMELIGRLQDVIFDRLFFPVCLPDFQILGFVSRTLDGSGAKYLTHSVHKLIPTRSLLFGLNFFSIYKGDQIRIVEGITDVFALLRRGIPSVSSFGAHLSFEQAAVVSSLYANKDIIICYDADQSGFLGVKQAIFEFAKFDIVPSIELPPIGLDPENVINKNEDFDSFSIVDYLKSSTDDKFHLSYINAFASPEVKAKLLMEFGYVDKS